MQYLHYNISRGAIMIDLKELRSDIKMTQKEAAEVVGISLRSYKSYENDISKRNTMKYNYIVEKLSKINYIDEDNGILDMDYIIRKCDDVFKGYDVSFCYLFGSYAKGNATQKSDVDLLIAGNIKGLKFYGLVEELRTKLHKRVDVLDINQLKNNVSLTEEILKYGIKIYG